MRLATNSMQQSLQLVAWPMATFKAIMYTMNIVHVTGRLDKMHRGKFLLRNVIHDHLIRESFYASKYIIN